MAVAENDEPVFSRNALKSKVAPLLCHHLSSKIHLFRCNICRFCRIHQPAQLAVPMCEKPYTHRRADATQYQQLVSDHQRRQHHQGHAAGGDGNAGRHTADDDLQRRIKHGGQAEQEHGDADPHDAFEARQLRAQFARRVLLRRAKLGLGSRVSSCSVTAIRLPVEAAFRPRHALRPFLLRAGEEVAD